MQRLSVSTIICCLLLVALLPVVTPRSVQGSALYTAPDIAWAHPTQPTLHNLGRVANAEQLRSYDCTPLSYRLIDDLSKTMHTGCFVPSALGLIDPDQSVAIFNGTDEAEPLRYGSGAAALSPLPYSATVARFGGFPVLGTYMYLYRYFPNALSNQRDLLLHRYKQVTPDTDMVVSTPDGAPLPVNPQAFAYSTRGEWLVTEVPGHSLVRINLATFDILPFATSLFIPSQPFAGHSAQLAISGDGRYAAVASREFSYFRVYDLSTCRPNSSDQLTAQLCDSRDYWPWLNSQVTGPLDTIARLRFSSDHLLSFDNTQQGITESYSLSPDNQPAALIPYLGLGDSFASGEGAFNYSPETDTSTNHCHLSVHAYPELLSADHFSRSGHSVACSGARMYDVQSLSNDYPSQTADQRSLKSRIADGSAQSILHDFTPGYYGQSAFVQTYQPGVTTVEVGGNDVGFKDMLLRCAAPGDCYTSYEDRLEVEQLITRHYGQWVATLSNLKKDAPMGSVYVLGYPQLVSPQGACSLNVHLSSGDIDFARNVVTYINGIIQQASLTAGVHYIDISHALEGHELCSAQGTVLAMNGLTAGTDTLGVFGHESYHPNAYGQLLIEQAILGATHNFSATTPTPVVVASPPSPQPSDPLLQAPVTGRPIRTILPTTAPVTPQVALKNKPISVQINTGDVALTDSGDMTISIGGVTAGTISSSGGETTTGQVIVPGGISSGIQPVEVSGHDGSGDPVTVVGVVYVSDGAPNAHDQCPDANDTTMGCRSTPTPFLSNDTSGGGGTSASNLQPALDARALQATASSSPVIQRSHIAAGGTAHHANTPNPPKPSALHFGTLPVVAWWWVVLGVVLLTVVHLVSRRQHYHLRYIAN